VRRTAVRSTRPAAWRVTRFDPCIRLTRPPWQTAAGVALAVCLCGPARGEGQRPDPASPSALGALSEAVQDLARRVHPCVVKVVAMGYLDSDDGGDQGTVGRGQSSGSGIVIDPDGYVVTNAHVLAGADHAQITLPASAAPPGWDGWNPGAGKILPARVIGVDAEADVALLKVPKAGLPYLPLTAEPVRQGQVVLAFGSPRGLDDSVSMGVVSSTARQFDPDDPIAYVQTDAPVNPGSSGGPLVNAAGEVVGISTLFLSQSGGSEGLGFAVPVELVRVVVDQLRRTGHTVRADLGLDVRTVNQALAAAWGLPATGGVVVQDVEPDGPGQEAGIRPGDLIESMDGQPLANLLQLNLSLYRAASGARVRLDVLRDGQRIAMAFRAREHESASSAMAAAVRKKNLISELGLFVTDMDQDLAEELAQARGKGGVLIAAMLGETPALGEDLRAGDIIYRMNRHPVTSSARLRELLRGMKPGDPVAFQVERAGRLRFVAAEIP
jgi:serine protease Do